MRAGGDGNATPIASAALKPPAAPSDPTSLLARGKKLLWMVVTSLTLSVLVCTRPQSPSLTLSLAAREVRSAARPCRGSLLSATPTQPQHFETRYGRIRAYFGPMDKGGRSFLAAARAACKIRCCKPCARGCLQSSKRARARADGEVSGRVRQIRLHFIYPGDLSEGRGALELACGHF